jgi:hypothetical protein
MVSTKVASNVRPDRNPFLLGVLLIASVSCSNSHSEPLKLLGKTMPKDSASVFAPGIISTNAFEFAITFSPEMDEVFWTRRKPDAKNVIMTMKWLDGN